MITQKISAVFCSKNDNQSNKTRIILTLRNLINLYDEVIFVDYGSEGLPLTDELKEYFPNVGKLKTIIVPPSFCKKLNQDGNNKFVEVYARNIGIRRASSDYIVSTNQDIICEKPNLLNSDTMYTVRRYNYPINLVDSLLEKQNLLEYLNSIKYTLGRQPMSVDETGNAIWDSGDIWSLVVSCGDYQIAHRKIWESIRGFEESMIGRCYADSNIMKKAKINGYNIAVLDLNIFHLDHPVNHSANYNLNDRIKYVNEFAKTNNSTSWGFSDIDFEEKIL